MRLWVQHYLPESNEESLPDGAIAIQYNVDIEWFLFEYDTENSRD